MLFLGLSSVIMLAVIRNFSEKITFLVTKILIFDSLTHIMRSKKLPNSLRRLDFQTMRKFPALIDLFEASYYQFIRLKNYKYLYAKLSITIKNFTFKEG